MIKLVDQSLVLPLRNLVLRASKGIEYAKFEGDEHPDTFHLAFIEDNEVRCISSFMSGNLPSNGDNGWQLRGMATHPDYLGNGFGKSIVLFAKELLLKKDANYLWCNARKTAVPFYEKLNFKIISPEFEIKNIGPHYQMIHLLK